MNLNVQFKKVLIKNKSCALIFGYLMSLMFLPNLCLFCYYFPCSPAFFYFISFPIDFGCWGPQLVLTHDTARLQTHVCAGLADEGELSGLVDGAAQLSGVAAVRRHRLGCCERQEVGLQSAPRAVCSLSDESC